MFQRAVFKQSSKRNLVQLRARADNLNANVAAKFNLGWIFICKKEGVNVPALTKQPGNFSVKNRCEECIARKITPLL